MSDWLPKALKTRQEKKSYPVTVNGRTLELSEQQIGELIKKKLKRSRVARKSFEEFGVSMDQLDDLIISITPMEGKVAETDGEVCKLAPEIIEDILTENFFIIFHELCSHFASRKSEEMAFFRDSEESWGMAVAIAGMMEQGYDFDTIFNKAWSKVGYHFHNEEDGREFMKRLFEKAQKMFKD